MWAYARYDLRLGEDEFWEMAPIELDALATRRNDEVLRADLRSATIGTLVANIFRDPKKSRPVTVYDFLDPGLRPKVKPRQSWQDQMQTLKRATTVSYTHLTLPTKRIV